MAERMGLIGGGYRPLTTEEIEKIHKTSMKVFEEVGVLVGYGPARELFRKAGAKVDESSGTVWVPSGLVEELVDRAPSRVNLCARESTGQWDCELGDKRVYVGTGGTALNVQEPGRKDSRPASIQDIRNMAWMVEHLDNIHVYMLNVYPNELSVEQVDVNRFGAAMNNTRKHVMGGGVYGGGRPQRH